MSKKYRLKKYLPHVNIGCEFEEIGNWIEASFPDGTRITYPKCVVEKNPEWFEEVEDRWKPDEFEYFYYFKEHFEIRRAVSFEYMPCNETDKFNCFKSVKQAEQARDLIKETLKKFHKGI